MLRRLNRDLAKDMRMARRGAAKLVIEDAERKGRALGGVHAHTVRAGALKARATGTRTAIVLDASRPKTEPAFGAEYGSITYSQFPPWRGNQWTNGGPGGGVGYFLHPAIRETQDDMIRFHAQAIDILLLKRR